MKRFVSLLLLNSMLLGVFIASPFVIKGQTGKVRTRTSINPQTGGGGNDCNPSGVNLALSSDADAAFNGYTFSNKELVDGTNRGISFVNPAFYVNGINTSLKNAKTQGYEIQQQTEHPVELVYNNSSSDKAFSLMEREFSTDDPSAANSTDAVFGRFNRKLGLAQSKQIADWAKSNVLNNPPAAKVLADKVRNQLNNPPINGDKTVRIVAYSQGAAITADALKRVKRCLPINQKDKMKQIRVFSIGGAAEQSDFPDEVEVSSLAHEGDNIAKMFGENRENFTNKTLFDLRKEEQPQHTNYLKGQNEGKSSGDPNVTSLLKSWFSGENFAFKLLKNVFN